VPAQATLLPARTSLLIDSLLPHYEMKGVGLALSLVCVGVVNSETIASYDQGAAFDKCISISDWESKTIDDDITLQDRDGNGCCPAGTVPGREHYTNYMGAQVQCGWQSDGTVDVSTTSGTPPTCTYNQCYVWKDNLECASGRQFLNGCCLLDSCNTNDCGFQTDCKNYAYSEDNVHSESYKYCLTYNAQYAMENTAAKTDDQANGMLETGNVYVYTPCAGGSGGGGGSGGSESSKAWPAVLSKELLSMISTIFVIRALQL
jgi:hypothetical protein